MIEVVLALGLLPSHLLAPELPFARTCVFVLVEDRKLALACSRWPLCFLCAAKMSRSRIVFCLEVQAIESHRYLQLPA